MFDQWQELRRQRMQVWNDIRSNYGVLIPARLRDRLTVDQLTEIREICKTAADVSMKTKSSNG